MGAFTSLSIIASLGQQLNTIVNWNDIKIAQWHNVKTNVGSAELNITGASLGADLVLFYIREHPRAPPSLTGTHLTPSRILHIQCRVAACILLVCTSRPPLAHMRDPPPPPPRLTNN